MQARDRISRRAVLGLAGLACLPLLGTTAAAESHEDGPSGDVKEWSQLQRDSRRTGVIDRVDLPLEELSPKWRYLRGMTPPVHGDGRLFVGDFLGILHALDAETGEPLWEYRPGDAWFLASVPAVSGETLVVGGVDGNVHGVDVQNGTRRWRQQIPDVEDDFPGLIPSSPAIHDGIAYITGGWNVYAFDLESGEEIWVEEGAGDAWGEPAVTADAVYSISQPQENAYLNVLDPESGLTRERIELNGPTWGNTPAVTDGTVYVGTRDGYVHAIRDGEMPWTTDVGDPLEWSSVAVGSEAVFAATTSGNLYALDRADGEPVWEFDEGADFEQQRPSVIGDVVFIGDGEDGNGDLYALDRSTGDVVWHHLFQTQSDWNTPLPPVVIDDMLYVSHGDALDAFAPGDHDLREVGQPIPPDAARSMLEQIQEHRGFLTNDPDSELPVLDDPVAMTWLGLGLSIAGIGYSMLKQG